MAIYYTCSYTTCNNGYYILTNDIGTPDPN